MSTQYIDQDKMKSTGPVTVLSCFLCYNEKTWDRLVNRVGQVIVIDGGY